jgi:hypothetical protein
MMRGCAGDGIAKPGAANRKIGWPPPLTIAQEPIRFLEPTLHHRNRRQPQPNAIVPRIRSARSLQILLHLVYQHIPSAQIVERPKRLDRVLQAVKPLAIEIRRFIGAPLQDQDMPQKLDRLALMIPALLDRFAKPSFDSSQVAVTMNQ